MMDDSYGEYSSNKSYISCMKMNGVPLLPPLMTPEYRQEMQYYKQLAMSVESRMYEMKMCLDETTINSNVLPSDSEEWIDDVNISTMSSKSNRDFFKQFTKETNVEEINFINNPYENNEFESMNSLVTVIDNDIESSLSSSAFVREQEESIGSFEPTTGNYTELEISSDSKNLTSQSETWNEYNEEKRKQQTSIKISKPIVNSDTSVSSPKSKVQANTNKSKTNLLDKRKVSNKKDVSKIDRNTPKSDSSKLSLYTKNKRDLLNKKENISPIAIKSGKKNNSNEKITKKTNKKSLIKLSPSKNVTGSLNNISTGLVSPPKLIRQNSYTLEHPSPLLLAHLEEQSLASGIDLRSISMSESTSTSFLCNSSKQKSWDSITAKETWSSIGSDINSISINEKINVKTPESKKVLDEKKNPDVLTDSEKHIQSSPADIYHKSIHSNSDLNEILKKFQEEHNVKLAKLVKKQEEEQLLLKKRFEKQQELILAQLQPVKIDKEDILPEKSVEISFNSTLEKENPILDNNDVLDVSKMISESSALNDKLINCINLSLIDSCKNQLNDRTKISNNSIVNSNHESIRSDAHDKNKTNYLNEDLLDLSKVSKDYYNENQLDDSIASERTNNTLDDINFTFAYDSSLNSSNSQILNYKDKDVESMSKLKSAFDKITKIQQNLASKPMYKNSSTSEKHQYLDNKYPPNDNQIISLSSISNTKPIYYDTDSQNSGLDRNMLSLNLTEIHRPRIDRNSRKTYVLKTAHYTDREIQAATIIVAYARGYLTRRLMRTERVESTVQTIRDTLMCALQLHRDEGGIQGADIDLHRRLIQQITAACYSLHDMFIVFTATERMSIIAQDRDRKISLSQRSASSVSSIRQLSATTQKIIKRKLENMSNSHSGVFTRHRTNNLGLQQMTRSHHEQHYHIKGLGDKSRRSVTVAGDFVCRKPWR